jgi:hypothetical protein
VARADAPLISAAHWIQSFKEDRNLPQSLAAARKTLVLIIESESWRAYYWPNHAGPDVVRWSTFEEFVTARPGKGGLGWTIRDLREYVRGDAVATDALDRVTQRKDGVHGRRAQAITGKGNGAVDNIHSSVSRPSGTSAQRALRVLREKAPELHAKVLAGKLSANAAMVEGGFRKKTVTLTVEVESAARTLRRAFTKRQLRRLVRMLENS